MVICLGTTNAFIASVSRLGYALARDGWAPRILTRRNRRDAPAPAIGTVAAIGGAGLADAFAFGWGTSDIVFIPSVLVLATYLLAAAAAARLFTGRRRTVAITALALLLVTVVFAGWHLLIPPAVAIAVILIRQPIQPKRDDGVDMAKGRFRRSKDRFAG